MCYEQLKMERTNVIKVIGYTPILIELCIPYFFTILQKFFVVELLYYFVSI